MAGRAGAQPASIRPMTARRSGRGRAAHPGRIPLGDHAAASEYRDRFRGLRDCAGIHRRGEPPEAHHGDGRSCQCPMGFAPLSPSYVLRCKRRIARLNHRAERNQIGNTEDMSNGYFIWTRMQAYSGLPITEVVKRREAERLAGHGVFWWVIGTSLGSKIYDVAQRGDGSLPVLFSLMPSRPRKADLIPANVYIWTAWNDRGGNIRDLPEHVLGWSREIGPEQKLYALVCRSETPLTISDHGPFTPRRLERPPSTRQVTALLEGDLDDYDLYYPGDYHLGFRAKLIEPWLVTLAGRRPLTDTERAEFSSRGAPDNWDSLIARLKGRPAPLLTTRAGANPRGRVQGPRPCSLYRRHAP